MKKRKPAWYKWAAFTVCAVLLAGISLLAPKPGSEQPRTGAILDVVYPKAYAFDDHDTWSEVREQNPVADDFIEAVNEFAYKTSPHILNNGGKNVNYSPLSLYFALSLAASGAKNETQAQLLHVLGVSDPAFLLEQSGNLYRTLYRDNDIGKLKIANSIWMNQEHDGNPVQFKHDFVKHAAEHFYASSHIVDFAKEEAGKAMTAWISANTNGTLSPRLETSADQILSILNTVYFYDEWVDQFDKEKTAVDVFHLADGHDVHVEFMNQTFGTGSYAKGKGFTRAGLGLKNGGQMVFILPDRGVSPYELLSSPEQMRKAFEEGEDSHGQIVWKIPKFSFQSNLDLANVLKKLGVISAFTPRADFSGITDYTAFFSRVLQGTHIAIDENGVEASAYTLIAYAGSRPPESRAEMILDRPFIYGITAPNGSLLFVGICENPAE
jgi:serine protease inhibitor